MIRIGIAGTGFGVEHYRLLKNNPGAKVIGIFGRNEKKLQEFEDKQLFLTTNLDELFDRDDIDLIDICLPTKLHAETIKKGLACNKNILCEMPLCETEEELESIDTSSQNRIYVSAFLKYFVEYEYLAKVIHDNMLGKVRTITFKRNTPPIWGNLNLDNIVLSFMLHEIDYVAWVFDSPMTVTVIHAFEKEKQSYIHSILRYPDLSIQLQTSSFLPASCPLTIGYEAFFEEGYVEFTSAFQEDKVTKRLVQYTKDRAEEINLDGIYPYEAMLNDVVFCETNKTKSRMDLEIAKKAMKIAFAIKRQVSVSR